MTKKKKGLLMMATSLMFIVACGVFYYFHSPQGEPAMTTEMSVDVYIQDKEIAAASDCSTIKKIAVQIPKTSDIADASLAFLFGEELAQYGEYDHVEVAGNVAKVFLKNSILPSGAPISSLSSCQVGHITSVLEGTLTQYGEIEFVELYSPEGKVEF